jgi:hypothetical protein
MPSKARRLTNPDRRPDLPTELRQLERRLNAGALRPEAANYLRGLRFLNAYTAVSDDFDATAVAFSKNRRAARVAAAVAEQYAVESKTLQADAKFAYHVQTIARNCGSKSLATMLAAVSRVTVKEIGMVSRMAPPRQKYEMQQAAKGKRIGVKPKGGVPPLDTVNFAEVANRMQRFQGMVAKYMPAFVAQGDWPPALKDKLTEEMRKMARNARQLRAMVKKRGTLPTTTTSDRHRPSARTWPTNAGDSRRLWMVARQVNGVIQKCLRDIPRLPMSVRPTKAEKGIIDAKLTAILKDVEAVLAGPKARATPTRRQS